MPKFADTQYFEFGLPVQKSKPTKELSVRMVGSGLWIYKVPLFRCNWIKLQTNFLESKLGFLTDLVFRELCLLWGCEWG